MGLAEAIASLFDQAESSPTVAGGFFDEVEQAAKAAMDTRMVPAPLANLLHIPNPTLGEAAEKTWAAAAVPGHLIAAPVQKLEEVAGIDKAPLFPIPGSAPVPELSGVHSPSVAQGTEFAGQVLAPAAELLAQGGLSRLLRPPVEEPAPGIAPKVDVEMKINPETGVAEAEAPKPKAVFDEAERVAMPEQAKPAEIAESAKPKTPAEADAVRAQEPVKPPAPEIEAAAKGDSLAEHSLFEKAKANIQEAASLLSADPVADAGSPKALMAKRFGDIAEGNYNTELFVRDLTSKLSPLEQSAMRYYMERQPPIKVDTPEQKAVADLAKNPTPAMVEADQRARRWFNNWHETLKQYFNKPDYVSNYLTHAWDLSGLSEHQIENIFSASNPFTKGRTVLSFAEGEAAGLKPRFQNFGDYMRLYANYGVRSIANQKLADELINSSGGELASFNRSRKTQNFVPIDSIRRNTKFETYDEGKPVTVKQSAPLLVHPAIYEALKPILKAPDKPGVWTRAIDSVNAIEKTLELSLGLFHHMLLTTNALAAGNPIGATLKAAVTGPVQAYKEMTGREFEKPAWKQPPMVRDALQHLVTIGGAKDVQPAALSRMLGSIADTLKANKATYLLGKGVDVAKFANELNSKYLWEYMQPAYKLMTYHSLVADSMKRFPNKSEDYIKNQIGQFTNDIYGGQPWQLLVKNPNTAKFLSRLLLAPDFKLSLWRAFVDATKGGFDPNLAKTLFTDEPKAYQARKFWLKHVFWYFTLGNIATYAITEALDGKGKGHFMLGNDSGHKLGIPIGRNEKGRWMYIEPDKMLADPIHFLINPAKYLGGAASPAVHNLVEQITGKTTTGFDLKFDEEGPTARVKVAAKHLTPIPLEGNSAMGLFPVSQGATPYQIQNEIYRALRNKDFGALKDIAKVAAHNNISYAKQYGIAQRKLRYKSASEAEASPPGFFNIKDLLRTDNTRR